MSVGTVRWRAVRPLAICGALGLGAWILFADRVAKHAVESVGTTLIGASVEIRRLHLDLPHGRVEVRGLTVASPFAALQNLLEADELVADVDPLPLLEKKVVIDRLAAKGLRFGTPRQTDGRTVGQSDGVRGQVERWTAQLHVPVLQFATGKIDVGQLDLSTLSTPAAAQSLAAQVDSVRTAWNGGFQGLGVAATVDSAKQMTDRLRGAKPTDLRLLGDARRTLDQVKRTRAGLAGGRRRRRAARVRGPCGATHGRSDAGRASHDPRGVGPRRAGGGARRSCAPHAARHRGRQRQRRHSLRLRAALASHPARAGAGDGLAQLRAGG